MKALILSLWFAPALALALASADPDTKFYRALAEGGNAEVTLGHLASDRATDPAVKEFSSRMIKDHSAANQELAALATSKSISLPDGLGMRGRAKEVELKALRGGAFDKAYISSQVKAHEETISLLQKEIASGKDADAQAFARKILPTVRSHLSAAKKLASSLQADSK